MLYRLCSFVCLVLAAGTGARAQPVGPAPSAADSTRRGGTDTLVVAVKEAPPFAMRGPGETWVGLSVVLWEQAAEAIGRPYVFREVPLAEMVPGVAEGRFDAAVAALTITAEREQRVDFSYPYYTSGLGVAVLADEGGGWFDAMRRLLSPAFLGVVLTLTVLLFVIGALVWFFERKRNPEQFGGGVGHGLASGFWWSAVTMTTVGYGDKAPQTVGGRLVALVWMFAALIVASSFTAAITTALTTSQLATSVRTAADLDAATLGAVDATSGAAHLRRQRLNFEHFDTPQAALDALASGQVKAVVHDAPILRYLLSRDAEAFRGVQVLPQRLTEEFYGVALPQGSPLREPVNRAVLQTLDSSAWLDARYRFLGEAGPASF